MKSIDAMQRTGVVRWLRHTGTFENPLEFEFEENVSVYEIVEHPYFNFCLGDVVMRLTMNKPEVEPSNFSKDFEQGLLQSTSRRKVLKALHCHISRFAYNVKYKEISTQLYISQNQLHGLSVKWRLHELVKLKPNKR